MRRFVPTVLLALLAVCLLPAPAHAYFWEWIDSLSGPRFGGVTAELQIACGKRSVAQSLPVLRSIKARILVEEGIYCAAKKNYSGSAQTYAANAVDYLEKAEGYLDSAIETMEKFEQWKKENPKQEATAPNPTKDVLASLAWQARAAEHFAWADRLEHNKILDPRKKPGEYTTEEPVEALDFETHSLPGIKYSRCKYLPLERDRHYLSVTSAFGVDIKNDDNQAEGRHLMWSAGLSYHVVLTPWWSIGAGGGFATFFRWSGDNAFVKPYIQPYIVDIKPGAFVRRAEVRSPWRHFVFVRFSGITYPGGFDPGQFYEGSPKYDTELVNSLGIHFDLTPVFRGRKGNW